MKTRTYDFSPWHGVLHPNILAIAPLFMDKVYTVSVELTDEQFMELILNTPGNFATLKWNGTLDQGDNVIHIGYTSRPNFGQW